MVWGSCKKRHSYPKRLRTRKHHLFEGVDWLPNSLIHSQELVLKQRPTPVTECGRPTSHDDTGTRPKTPFVLVCPRLVFGEAEFGPYLRPHGPCLRDALPALPKVDRSIFEECGGWKTRRRHVCNRCYTEQKLLGSRSTSAPEQAGDWLVCVVPNDARNPKPHEVLGFRV